jgi:hypothetical protein
MFLGYFYFGGLSFSVDVQTFDGDVEIWAHREIWCYYNENIHYSPILTTSQRGRHQDLGFRLVGLLVPMPFPGCFLVLIGPLALSQPFGFPNTVHC